MNFLALLNHKLGSSETFSGFVFSHEYHVIELSKFCLQTESVQNGCKFLVAKWTELALYEMALWRMLWSQLDAVHDSQNL